MAFQLDIKDNANTQDTVQTIIEVINKTSKEGFAPKLATALNPNGSKLEYIRRLFDFICKNVDYQQDPPGWEKIYTPAKLFQDAKGDCKKMTTAIAAVLKAAGIEPLLKVITYDGKNWAHIYVICKINQRYYVLDPVNYKKFDSEIKHKRAAVYNLAGNFEIMPGTKLSILGGSDKGSVYKGFTEGLQELSGDIDGCGYGLSNMLGGESSEGMSGPEIDDILAHFQSNLNAYPNLSGIGKIKLGEKLKNALTKIVHVGSAVSAAPFRAAFLGLVILGKALEHTPLKMKLAHKLAEAWQQDNGAKLSSMWKKFGGDPNALKKAIAKGSSTQLAGILENGDFDLKIDGVSTIGSATAIAASITAATPILIAVQKYLKEAKVVKAGSPEDTGLTDTTKAGMEGYNDDGTLPDSVKNKLKDSGLTDGKSGGIIDLSGNTIIKALFLIFISGMIPGINFYVLNFVCFATIIIYLFTKFYKHEIQL